VKPRSRWSAVLTILGAGLGPVLIAHVPHFLI
jgi:hypothetical protein